MRRTAAIGLDVSFTREPPDALQSTVTVLSPLLVTHMWVPSNAMPHGRVPTVKVPSVAPAGDSSVTVLSPLLATHMFVPSNAIPAGALPTGNVPSVAPVGPS